MQQDAIDCASQAIDKYEVEKDIASYIKKEFDKKHGPTWHCAVGRNLGSFVTHEAKTMVLIICTEATYCHMRLLSET
jgi:dynein light chain LC8-type